VMTRLGITSTNETIPAVAEIKAAYERHFQIIPLETKYQIKGELSRLLSLGDGFSIPRAKQISKPNLISLTKKFGLVANAFSSYSNWATMAQGIKLIEALTIAKMV